MRSAELDKVTQMVLRAVAERLGQVDRGMVEAITREVMSTLSRPSSKQQPSLGALGPTPAAPANVAASLAMRSHCHSPSASFSQAEAAAPQHDGARTLETCINCVDQKRRQSQKRAIVTTTGRNCRGVVASVAAQVAAAGGDIRDISQTIVSDYFTMIMVVDITELSLPFSELKQKILAAAEGLGIHAVVIHEDVMRALQRI